ncbi:hypothetical protein D9758_004744 [Tetrapyrgos nigripes]|uniref:DH domain-containing protein n=1 Tax=Tetrapyrgos nigripes TaxID=182062 RepID=A0A8H5G601_9AGAR|nr:hypothetical protein D9758_004744 [Tetrapyrgos nigripes]
MTALDKNGDKLNEVLLFRLGLAVCPPTMTSVTVKADANSPGSSSRLSRRPTVSGFLPMPPISASPVCTPTLSTSSRDFDDPHASSSSVSAHSYCTSPTTPSDSSCNRFLPLPTWISTPPTPPPKLVRRSVTCVTRRPHSHISPSTSFPASKSPRAHSGIPPKRRASAPSMFSQARSMSSTPFPSSSENVPVARNPQVMPQDIHPLRPKLIRSREFPTKHVLYDVAHHVSYDDDALDNADHRSDPGTSVESSASPSGHKDDIRRFHAFMELLTTELAYLLDLRILVTVYLRHLSSLKRASTSSTFSRSSSFSALSRANSYAPLGNGSPILFDLQPLPVHKETKKYLFTEFEVDILTRNAEQMLLFHEQFVEELKLAIAPLGFPDLESSSKNWESTISPDKYREGIGNVDAGIAMVSTKFAIESSRFTSYETFCAGHPEAMDILRRVQQQYPAEWELFELKSGSLASDLLGTSNSPPHLTSASHETLPTKVLDDTASIASSRRRRRRGSVASLENIGWNGRSRSQSSSAAQDFTPSRKSRLACMDYFIKPVQRICKYPLLLDSLKRKSSYPVPKLPVGHTDVNVIVESAAQAMRHVASAVDEARKCQDIKVKSSLISSRMTFQLVAQSFFNSSAPHPPLQVLTPAFVASLGVCHMAGCLDIIHHRATKSTPNKTHISVKYMGAFLYKGGYLILVKVLKGKAYEPRHWFRLCEFQISDPGEGEAWLPCSFRISCKGHAFEFAAACQQEKDVWMNVIRESMLYPTVDYIHEPVSSLQVDGKGELIPSNLDGPFEAIHSLPTIQSISELAAKAEEDSTPESPESKPVLSAKSSSSSSSSSRRKGPSRHSSAVSMKSMFTPRATDSDTVIIRRPLLSSRTTVDHGLQDVISESCIMARSQAVFREQELFQPPQVALLGSASRLSTSSGTTKSRLKKQESVRVSRKSIVDSEDIRNSLKEALKSTSLSVKRHPKRPVILPSSPDGTPMISERPLYSTTAPPSPSPRSIPLPSRSNSGATSPSENCFNLTSPVDDNQSFRNSFTGSIRGFLGSRPPSPSRGSATLAMTPLTAPTVGHHHTLKSASRFFKRWAHSGKGSLSISQSHRRAHSAPDDNIIRSIREDSTVLSGIGEFGTHAQLTESPV